MSDEPTPSETPAGVLRQVQTLSSAIDAAKKIVAATPNTRNALEVQRLKRRRSELQATLPPLRLVE